MRERLAYAGVERRIVAPQPVELRRRMYGANDLIIAAPLGARSHMPVTEGTATSSAPTSTAPAGARSPSALPRSGNR